MSLKLVAIAFTFVVVLLSVCIFLQRSAALLIDVLFKNMTIKIAVNTMKEDIKRVLLFFSWPFIFISKAFRVAKTDIMKK